MIPFSVIPPTGLVQAGLFKAFGTLPPEEDYDNQIATTYLGTPVFDNLVFDDDKTLDENTLGDTVSNKLRIDTCLLIIHQTKNIVKTPVQGRNGTVKEYIAQGDYLITIRGFLVSPESNVFPYTDMAKLKKFCEAGKAINVTCQFLAAWGIRSIVIDEYTPSQVIGHRNMMAFDIQASSDTPFEIQVT